LRPTKPPTHRTAERNKKGKTVFETILFYLFGIVLIASSLGVVSYELHHVLDAELPSAKSLAPPSNDFFGSGVQGLLRIIVS
jgi:hypothetical protein